MTPGDNRVRHLDEHGGRDLSVVIGFVDGSEVCVQTASGALARSLFDRAAQLFHVTQTDLFGLQYEDKAKLRYWLDLHKRLNKQKIAKKLWFALKFYPPQPHSLPEELRNVVALQLQRDLAAGMLGVEANVAVALAALAAQAECGDYDVQYQDEEYVLRLGLLPTTLADAHVAARVRDQHCKQRGLAPEQARVAFLQLCGQLQLYGLKGHDARDDRGLPVQLASNHAGVVMLQHERQLDRWPWSKIRKLSFKRRRFLIKPRLPNTATPTVFIFATRDLAKNFWKVCVEQHSFFVLDHATVPPRPLLLSRGSSFRYRGRTHQQLSLESPDDVSAASLRLATPTPIRPDWRRLVLVTKRLAFELESLSVLGGQGELALLHSSRHSILALLYDFHEWAQRTDDGAVEAHSRLSHLLPFYDQLTDKLAFILRAVSRMPENACTELEARSGHVSWPWLVAAAAWHPIALRRAMATLSPDDVAVQRLFPQLDSRHQEIVELCLRLELERDMGGWARFVAEDSGALLRVGCLLKLSKKGFQPRLFVLFANHLVYAARSANSAFRLHGHLPLNLAQATPTDPQLGHAHCFTVFGGEKALLLAACSSESRAEWLSDIERVAHSARPTVLRPLAAPVTEGGGARGVAAVTWHRGVSVSLWNAVESASNAHCGFLLRKFKSGNGWQRLFVENKHLTLLFYKNEEERTPLATLPLLGYCLHRHSEPFAFELRFKQHVYLFKAESGVDFDRWTDSLASLLAIDN